MLDEFYREAFHEALKEVEKLLEKDVELTGQREEWVDRKNHIKLQLKISIKKG